MPREDNDPTITGLIVQLLEEQRSDLKEMRREVHDGFEDLRTRVTRLEAAQAANATPPALVGLWRSVPAKGAVGVTGVVTLAYAVVSVLQSLGALPPPAAHAVPPPAPPALIAPAP